MTRIAAGVTLLLLATTAVQAQTSLTPDQRLAREILAELVSINTTQSVGSTTQAAEAMRARLLAAGLAAEDVLVLGPSPRKRNLVARLRGRDRNAKPIVLLAHIDVVEANAEVFYGETNAHGMNERIPVKSFYEGQEFLYRLVKLLATESARPRI